METGFSVNFGSFKIGTGTGTGCSGSGYGWSGSAFFT